MENKITVPKAEENDQHNGKRAEKTNSVLQK